MASMTNLKRQHVEIINTIKIIDELMKSNDFEKDSKDIAKSISTLAGKLKIHLDTEDKFLYPNLAKHDNISVRNKANKYIDEMGNICKVFTDYKNKFNTKSKIMNSLDEFKKESKYIFDTIKKRISKEDVDLYPLL